MLEGVSVARSLRTSAALRISPFIHVQSFTVRPVGPASATGRPLVAVGSNYAGLSRIISQRGMVSRFHFLYLMACTLFEVKCVFCV